MNKSRKSTGQNVVGKLERIDLKDYTVTEPATRDEIKQMLKKILKSKNSVKDIEKIMKNQHHHLYENEIRKISINQNIGIDKKMANIKNNYILKEIGERLLNLKSNERIIFETVIQPDILEKIRECQIKIALENFDVKSSSKSKSSSLSISKIKNPKLNSKSRTTREELYIIKEVVNGTNKVPIITTNPFTSSSLSSKKSSSSLMDFDFENDHFDEEPKNKKRKRKTGGNLTRRKTKSKRRRTSVRRR
jgi:hypothetical protein